MVGLTPADRKWMDDIVKDVNDGYSEDPDMSLNAGMQYVHDCIILSSIACSATIQLPRQ